VPCDKKMLIIDTVPYKVWDAKIDREMNGTVRCNVNTVSK